jgi:hypothetical protein
MRAAHRDRHRVLARVAWLRLQRRKTAVICLVVVVVVDYRWMMMFVRGWAVVVLRMIVPEVLMHVQGRPHGRRDDQGLNERVCDKTAHDH